MVAQQWQQLGWRGNGPEARTEATPGTVDGVPLCLGRVMFWVSLALAIALMALEFAFIWFVDHFADRVKHMFPSRHPRKRVRPAL
jgi:hypothetical protein